MLLQKSETHLMVICVILLMPFYKYSSSCWQEWYQVFTERTWQGRGSAAQTPGLFLLDYLIIHMGYCLYPLWESLLVTKMAE